MSGTKNAARLREALAIVLKESAGIFPPPLEDSALVARLSAACARFCERTHLTPHELLSFAQGDRFDPVFRNMLLENFSDKSTAFFRNKEMFSYISENVPRNNAQKKVTIWCAACSTGQEAFSLAIAWRRRVLRESAREEEGTRLVVYASDMSTRAVETAQAGRYNNFDVQHGLNVHDLLGFFDEQSGGGFWKAKDALLSQTIFFQHNLLHSPPSFLPRRLDAILLPNTLLNFYDPIAERILARLAALLAPEGWLVLAPHEADRYGELLLSQRPRNSQYSLEHSSLPKGFFARRALTYPDRGEMRAAAKEEEQDFSRQHSSTQTSRAP